MLATGYPQHSSQIPDPQAGRLLTFRPTCLLACMLACLPACLPACLLACLLACIFTSRLTCQYLLSYFPSTHIHTSLSQNCTSCKAVTKFMLSTVSPSTSPQKRARGRLPDGNSLGKAFAVVPTNVEADRILGRLQAVDYRSLTRPPICFHDCWTKGTLGPNRLDKDTEHSMSYVCKE